MAGAGSPESRPVSPHLQVWRWHVTMLGSILHRATGVAGYAATIGLVIWLVAVAVGPDAYTPIAAILSAWYGQTALYLLVAAFSYHFANGIRHLVLDTGAGMRPGDADTSSWFAILFAIVAPLGLWALVHGGA